MKRVAVAAPSVMAAVWLCAQGVAAQDFYAGKQMRLIVGSAAGGGYDFYARLMQRHMPKYLPGSPTVVVMNMPGAGGLIAANHVANLAEKDGTAFGAFNRYSAVMPFLGNEQAKFKTEAFQWLGTTASYSDNAYLVVIRGALPHRTVADMRNPAMALAIGSSGTDVPAILKEALGLNFKLISGYKGGNDIELAFERGEIDGHTSGYSSIVSRHGDWLGKGEIRPMIQFGRIDRLEILKDVPTARELAQSPADRALIEFAELPLLMARPFAAPPGTPAERVALLRAAFMKTVSDADYLEEGKKQRLELTPKSGEEVQAIVADLAKVEPAVVQRYLKALDGKLPSGN